MIGLPEFQKMKRSAIIVNTARGGLIVEDDLATAVRKRMIAGAAIDFLASEPPDDDHPLVQLSRERNFILTTAHGVGQHRGDADPVGPDDRQHRKFRKRDPDQRLHVKLVKSCDEATLACSTSQP